MSGGYVETEPNIVGMDRKLTSLRLRAVRQLLSTHEETGEDETAHWVVFMHRFYFSVSR